MKTKQFLLLTCCLACLAMTAACSTDDADAAADIGEFHGYGTSGATAYSGQWTFYRWKSDNQYETGNKKEGYVIFYERELSFDLTQMPISLFLNLAGAADATPVDTPRYVVKCQNKGYSSTTHIYELTMPAYTFNYMLPDGEMHTVRVIFNEKGEVGIDSYVDAMSLMVVIDGIFIDDHQYISGGMLTFGATQITARE